jgi:hypothetical protein
MSELAPSHERYPHSVIADGMHEWLYAEIQNSYSNNNAVLNDYPGFEKDLALPFDHPANVMASKARSHHQRLKLWTDEVFAYDDSDPAIARQLFGVMMGLSGAYREQCFVVSNDQFGYMRLRYSNQPLGADLREVVRGRVVAQFGHEPAESELEHVSIAKSELITRTHQVNNFREETVANLYSQKPVRGVRKALIARRLADLRRAWYELGVDYILYAAQQRGGELAKVPFLEPKTIAAAELVYPFAGEPPYFKPDDRLDAK